MNDEIERALMLVLARRDDRKRAEQNLESLRRQENDAVERLQTLVRATAVAGEPVAERMGGGCQDE